MGLHSNPVERRLGLIRGSWVESAELPDARVLCMLVAPDEPRTAEAFVAVESDEH
jgi:hypothetical protein